jgi:hypothetical protein
MITNEKCFPLSNLLVPSFQNKSLVKLTLYNKMILTMSFQILLKEKNQKELATQKLLPETKISILSMFIQTMPAMIHGKKYKNLLNT